MFYVEWCKWENDLVTNIDLWDDGYGPQTLEDAVEEAMFYVDDDVYVTIWDRDFGNDEGYEPEKLFDSRCDLSKYDL